MPPRRGGRRGTMEPEGRIDRIKRILKGLVQVVQDTHNNHNNNAPEQPEIPVPRVEVVGHITIKQFQTNFSRSTRSHGRGILAFGN